LFEELTNEQGTSSISANRIVMGIASAAAQTVLPWLWIVRLQFKELRQHVQFWPELPRMLDELQLKKGGPG
jgi:hypothetical protein